MTDRQPWGHFHLSRLVVDSIFVFTDRLLEKKMRLLLVHQNQKKKKKMFGQEEEEEENPSLSSSSSFVDRIDVNNEWVQWLNWHSPKAVLFYDDCPKYRHSFGEIFQFWLSINRVMSRKGIEIIVLSFICLPKGRQRGKKTMLWQRKRMNVQYSFVKRIESQCVIRSDRISVEIIY